ncbi:hypothetical protein DICPUDRAFT_92787 [Dictyostelium purpureum]|uniref:Uncharacterized protein n=1 Tax=Dictyostelium purpureum TaxID=5786 RepID=F0ZX58_DICPU|nr:uncharacterized protein DICPUDRAFT_92787 [Dictyostelium purpureum]EGC31471.1 hypothetical protein DICPUDRAFT_92787 [Dictyostelium purpureum]|eukprot:XP_003292010.1 hypothetical protein DICPUDRAFT_92787 [Dictyostelium purpureum]
MTFQDVEINEKIPFINVCKCGSKDFENSESKRAKLFFYIGHIIIIFHFLNLSKLFSSNDTAKRYAIGSLSYILFSLSIFLYIALFLYCKMGLSIFEEDFYLKFKTYYN